jgi:hypothetical protein
MQSISVITACQVIRRRLTLRPARDFIMTELVTKLDLEAALDRVTLRMTVRFGVMLVAGLGALAAILKLA